MWEIIVELSIIFAYGFAIIASFLVLIGIINQVITWSVRAWVRWYGLNQVLRSQRSGNHIFQILDRLTEKEKQMGVDNITLLLCGYRILSEGPKHKEVPVYEYIEQVVKGDVSFYLEGRYCYEYAEPDRVESVRIQSGIKKVEVPAIERVNKLLEILCVYGERRNEIMKSNFMDYSNRKEVQQLSPTYSPPAANCLPAFWYRDSGLQSSRKMNEMGITCKTPGMSIRVQFYQREPPK